MSKSSQRGATKIEVMIIMAIVAIVLAIIGGSLKGCDIGIEDPVSDSGVSKASVSVPTNSEGLTTEQHNVRERLLRDNKPGSIKHLYIISSYSGQVIMYSTVKGKVTSSGKRLTPTSVAATDGQSIGRQHYGIPVKIGGETRRTSEVLQDDGTYGSSIPYLYWFDANGKYHQHYVAGGHIVHVSDQPIAVRDVIITVGTEK